MIASLSSTTRRPTEAELLRRTETYITERLKDGAWTTVAEIRDSIPADLASARADLSSALAYSDTGPVGSARPDWLAADLIALLWPDKLTQTETAGQSCHAL